jgi:hypothetical protein
MKNIRGHKSWNFDEVIAMLAKGGSFTVPTLPHYRYDRVKRIRATLCKVGAIKQTGRCETSISYTATDKFKQWRSELESKATTLGVVKFVQPSPYLCRL